MDNDTWHLRRTPWAERVRHQANIASALFSEYVRAAGSSVSEYRRLIYQLHQQAESSLQALLSA